MIALLLLVLSFSMTARSVEYHWLGCFKDRYRSRALPVLYGNCRGWIDWRRYQTEGGRSIVDWCAQGALEKGMECFSVQFYGECFGPGGLGKCIGYDKYGNSSKCRKGVGGPLTNAVYYISTACGDGIGKRCFDGSCPTRFEDYPWAHFAQHDSDCFAGQVCCIRLGIACGDGIGKRCFDGSCPTSFEDYPWAHFEQHDSDCPAGQVCCNKSIGIACGDGFFAHCFNGSCPRRFEDFLWVHYPPHDVYCPEDQVCCNRSIEPYCSSVNRHPGYQAVCREKCKKREGSYSFLCNNPNDICCVNRRIL